MCGRITVEKPISQWITERVQIDFPVTENKDLRPTQAVSVLARPENSIIALKTTWGIKPSWSKQILINAQAETVAEKKTFKNAFKHSRCLVPCSGWYEWKDEGQSKKQRYLFSSKDDSVFLMAGILFESEEGYQLVTLTTQPNKVCAEIHSRMPLLIASEHLEHWLDEHFNVAQALCCSTEEKTIHIAKYQ